MIWVALLQFSHFRKNINQKHYQKQKYYYQQKHLILHGGAICAANNLVQRSLSFDQSIKEEMFFILRMAVIMDRKNDAL